MKYFCKACERVLNEESEMYQTTEVQTLEYWGVPFNEVYKTNHCCYCNSDQVKCLDTEGEVYTVTHKVGNVLIMSNPLFTEEDANSEVVFLRGLGKVGTIRCWE